MEVLGPIVLHLHFKSKNYRINELIIYSCRYEKEDEETDTRI